MKILDYQYADGYLTAVAFLAAQEKDDDEYIMEAVRQGEDNLITLGCDRWVARYYGQSIIDTRTGKKSQRQREVVPTKSKSWICGFLGGYAFMEVPIDEADKVLVKEGESPTFFFTGPLEEVYKKVKEECLAADVFEKVVHISHMSDMVFDSLGSFSFQYNHTGAFKPDGTVNEGILSDYTDDEDYIKKLIVTYVDIRSGFDSNEDFEIAMNDFIYHPDVAY